MWGSVRRKPYIAPEAVSITLLGPGVPVMVMANRVTETHQLTDIMTATLSIV